MKDVHIAILGFGNVGMGVWEILMNNGSKVDCILGRKVEIKKILVRDINKKRSIDVPDGIFTDNIDDIISDDDIDIVVELMGGIQPAFQYIKESLKNGKHVVTANKAVMATRGRELLHLANEAGRELRYEASVAGGIPIINTLNKDLAANNIEEITGIINGTTNYILTQMTTRGMSFDEALKQAQDMGYAEADPSSDIEGEDAAFKLSILTSIAFGVQVSPEKIPTHGITNVTEMEIEYARQLGYTVKLLSKVKKVDKKLELYVHPALVPSNHPLAAVSDEFNALFIRGDAVGDLMLYGKGAGSLPTGSAVLSDIMYIIDDMDENNDRVIKRRKYNGDLEAVGEGKGEYYIRFQVADEPGVLGMISTTFGKYGISLASVVQQGHGEKSVPLVFVTHKVERTNLDAALKAIENCDFIEDIACILKVEKFKRFFK